MTLYQKTQELDLCCDNAGPLSATLARHQPSIGSIFFSNIIGYDLSDLRNYASPQRRRQWPNIKPALAQ